MDNDVAAEMGAGPQKSSGCGSTSIARTLPSRAALSKASHASLRVLYFLWMLPEISLTVGPA